MNESPNRDVVIFTEAVDLPADERSAYLERVCGGDVKLRQRVEALLQTHDHVGDFLEQSAQKGSIEARTVGSAGESSIDAALNPAQTDYLYYVRDPARNDGAHNFYSKSADFEKGVRALREWERTRDSQR